MQIKNAADLRAAILELEDRKQMEKKQLAEKFHLFTESLRPINLIKSTFKSVKDSPGLTGNILDATIGLGVGMISQKLLVGKSAGLAKKLLGTAVKMGVTSAVANNTDAIKNTAIRLFRKFFATKRKDSIA
jgi:hypothetical protein